MITFNIIAIIALASVLVLSALVFIVFIFRWLKNQKWERGSRARERIDKLFKRPKPQVRDGKDHGREVELQNIQIVISPSTPDESSGTNVPAQPGSTLVALGNIPENRGVPEMPRKSIEHVLPMMEAVSGYMSPHQWRMSVAASVADSVIVKKRHMRGSSSSTGTTLCDSQSSFSSTPSSPKSPSTTSSGGGRGRGSWLPRSGRSVDSLLNTLAEKIPPVPSLPDVATRQLLIHACEELRVRQKGLGTAQALKRENGFQRSPKEAAGKDVQLPRQRQTPPVREKDKLSPIQPTRDWKYSPSLPHSPSFPSPTSPPSAGATRTKTKASRESSDGWLEDNRPLIFKVPGAGSPLAVASHRHNRPISHQTTQSSGALGAPNYPPHLAFHHGYPSHSYFNMPYGHSASAGIFPSHQWPGQHNYFPPYHPMYYPHFAHPPYGMPLHDERPQTSRGRQGSHHRHESSGGGSKASSTTGVDGINVKSSSPSVGNGPHSLYGATAFGQGYLHPHHYPDPSANYGMIGLTSASHEMAATGSGRRSPSAPPRTKGSKAVLSQCRRDSIPRTYGRLRQHNSQHSGGGGTDGTWSSSTPSVTSTVCSSSSAASEDGSAESASPLGMVLSGVGSVGSPRPRMSMVLAS